MDYNRIDILEKGIIWQGGTVDNDIDSLDGPLLIICMDQGESNEQWINHTTVEAVLAVWIDDSPTACLKDEVLLGLVEAAAGWLNYGNIYVHCAAGVSRASYFDIALHMKLNNWTFDQAYSEIKSQRPVANPNDGFKAQLQRLSPGLNINVG